KLGARFVDVSLPHTPYALPAYYLISCSEASANLARYDGVRYSARMSDDSLYDVYAQTRDRCFGPEVKRRILLGTYALSAGYYDQFYGKAQRVRTLIQRDFSAAFQQADLLLAPTSPTPAFKLGEKVDDPVTMYLTDVYTVSINLAGVPAISIPGGTVEGLPFGLQLIADTLQEAKLLRAAYAFEQSC
ncbi:MAG TPA: amidase family protein, partial [Candidatus Bipolaricaulota bacterium]